MHAKNNIYFLAFFGDLESKGQRAFMYLQRGRIEARAFIDKEIDKGQKSVRSGS